MYCEAKSRVSQNGSQHQSLEELRGKLLYSITIPQLGIVANGLLDKTDPVDWILLDYIRRWELNKKAQAITKDGKRLIRINFKHLLESLPILHYFKIHSKPPITRKLQKLEKLGLIETFKAKDNTLFARLTEKAWECYQTRLSEQIEDETSPPVSFREKRPVSHIDKYPIPPREEQHNRESIENHNSKSLKDYRHKKRDDPLGEENSFSSFKDKNKNTATTFRKEDIANIVNELVVKTDPLTTILNGYEAGRLPLEQVKEILNTSELYKDLKKSKAFAPLTPEQKAEADSLLEEIKKKNYEALNGRIYHE